MQRNKTVEEMAEHYCLPVLDNTVNQEDYRLMMLDYLEWHIEDLNKSLTTAYDFLFSISTLEENDARAQALIAKWVPNVQ